MTARVYNTQEAIQAAAEIERRRRLERTRKKAEPPLYNGWLKLACSGPRYTWDWDYQLKIEEALDRVTRGSLKRLMIFIPPRHGKSELVTVRYPIYRLELDPTIRIIIGAYNQTLASKFARKARKLGRERLTLSDERTAVDDWETSAGGGVRAVGVGSGITGQGGDIIIIDDPVKGRREAKSLTNRDLTYDWYTDDIYTRLEPGGAVILIQTRWHEDDLAGRILNSEDGKNWEVISLPAEAEAGDPLGRAIGDPLNPERYPKKELERLRTVLGKAYYALYQQRPHEQEGDIFRRSWFSIVADTEAPRLGKRVRYWDRASTQDGGDWTVGLLLCKPTGSPDYIVEHLVRGQWSTAERDRIIKQTAEADRSRYGRVEIMLEQEPGSSGVDVIRGLTSLLAGYIVRGDKVTGDKALRAEPVAAQAESGFIKLVRGSWNETFIDQVASFPDAPHDDIVDALSGAFNRLARPEKLKAGSHQG